MNSLVCVSVWIGNLLPPIELIRINTNARVVSVNHPFAIALPWSGRLRVGARIAQRGKDGIYEGPAAYVVHNDTWVVPTYE